MRKRFAEAIRSGKPNKNKPGEQPSTERNDAATSASNDNDNDNQQKTTQDLPSQYGIRQVVSSRYLIRKRLVNLLEERFPGRWSLTLRFDTLFIDLPAPLSPEDLDQCVEGSTSGSSG
ncbi:hypothetical protein P168DRAFT_186647 [Aspergillus campestris IBT 28561]|uniref:Uncharacterized protein n=1 Tax=Aspergillus campestris (strain IBT 28561) TaxID=1392248 RepID=A0A2I1CY92_ASPC2|nr:uncharacterized protein P168DRAFT_186647 [Aspergillus campestris IBT 28561]PKY02583.1 hypothetical protein P168DRAFT_186647 [Aspergillus campestris IBT 28561]